MFRLVEWRGDDHAFLRNFGERYVKFQSLFGVAEVVVTAEKMPFFAVVFKSHGKSACFCGNVTLFGSGRHAHLPHRERRDFRIVHLKRFARKAQKRNAVAGHEACVGNSQAQADVLISDVIIIPFFDADFFGFYVLSVVNPKKFFRKSRFGDVPFFVQKTLRRGDFMLSVHNFLRKSL